MTHASGAKLIVSDIHGPTVNKVASELSAEIYCSRRGHIQQMLMFIHHAQLGGVLTQSTIPQIKARVIAGAANNQLENRIRWATFIRARYTICPRLRP